MIFATPGLDRAPTPEDLTVWLHKAMEVLGISPPPGLLYSS